MKNKMMGILQRVINFFKNNWKKVAVIAGAFIIVVVIGVVSLRVRANKIENSIREQLSGKTFESFEDLGNDMWSLSSYTFQENGKYMNDEYYCYGGNSDSIEHTSYDGTTRVEVSLFGKASCGIFDVILDDGEVKTLKSPVGYTYEIVETSHLQQIAIEVFCQLTEWKNSNYGEMIETIYKDYDVTCTAVEGSDTKYVFTFEGNYYPNKHDLPNFTIEGTLSVEVDIATKKGKILEDDGIRTAMNVWVVLSSY